MSNVVLNKQSVKLFKTNPPQRNKKGFIIFTFFALILGIIAAYKWEDFVEKDENGRLRIAKSREEKFKKDSLAFSNACMQYALVANSDGIYPCNACPNTNTIFLKSGEIWYYGETCKGENGRYGDNLKGLNLLLRPEFYGNKSACIIEQKRKIYQYPILPENVLRSMPIARPPGNKNDN